MSVMMESISVNTTVPTQMVLIPAYVILAILFQAMDSIAIVR